jgi:hypothetical protein
MVRAEAHSSASLARGIFPAARSFASIAFALAESFCSRSASTVCVGSANVTVRPPMPFLVEKSVGRISTALSVLCSSGGSASFVTSPMGAR